MPHSKWEPKPGDLAWYVDDVKVTIVRAEGTPGIWLVRYADRDNFGERATFAADRWELLPRTADDPLPPVAP